MRLIGTGSAIPEKVVTNAMLSEFLDTSDEWIVPRTGIRSRHVITDENVEDLGARACLNALDMAGLKPEDIDYFICSNVVNEYITPSLSCVIAEKSGLTCPCIDINCACPGFLYAMDIAETHFLAGKVKNVLIVSAEEPTRMTDWADRSTCVLFGDGAGAAVFTEGDNLKGIRLHSQPDSSKIWQKRTLMPTPYITKQEEDVPLQMRGKEVFKFAVGASTTEVAEKFPVNIQDHGNSSSASCAILLDECNRKGMFKPGDILVFSAFGAGLLSAAAVLEW